MVQLIVHPQPLTREAFAPFGEVIELREDNPIVPINYGLTERHHALARVQTEGGDAVISLFYSRPVELPFSVQVMERHPLGSQAFMPLSDNPYLVVVAPAGAFDRQQLRAFIASPRQGVNYRAGTWHHYCLTLNAASEFLVVDRDGAGENCDEIRLPDPVILEARA